LAIGPSSQPGTLGKRRAGTEDGAKTGLSALGKRAGNTDNIMMLDEFENATVSELRTQANNCFAQAVTAGTGDRPYLYAEAQFYIAEIERRKQGKANTISFWMELFVIVLILAEIVITLWEGKG
jgi:hypothetical protein